MRAEKVYEFLMKDLHNMKPSLEVYRLLSELSDTQSKVASYNLEIDALVRNKKLLLRFSEKYVRVFANNELYAKFSCYTEKYPSLDSYLVVHLLDTNGTCIDEIIQSIAPFSQTTQTDVVDLYLDKGINLVDYYIKNDKVISESSIRSTVRVLLNGYSINDEITNIMSDYFPHLVEDVLMLYEEGMTCDEILTLKPYSGFMGDFLTVSERLRVPKVDVVRCLVEVLEDGYKNIYKQDSLTNAYLIWLQRLQDRGIKLSSNYETDYQYSIIDGMDEDITLRAEDNRQIRHLTTAVTIFVYFLEPLLSYQGLLALTATFVNSEAKGKLLVDILKLAYSDYCQELDTYLCLNINLNSLIDIIAQLSELDSVARIDNESIRLLASVLSIT